MGTPLDDLKSAVKAAVVFGRDGKWEDFYATYARLFYSPEFPQNRNDDQRQALRLMIMTKGLPAPTSEAGVQAYQGAWYALNRLVGEEHDARDYELFGLVYLRLGAPDDAQKVFQAGLDLAHAKDDAELCGAFLRHLSNF